MINRIRENKLKYRLQASLQTLIEEADLECLKHQKNLICNLSILVGKPNILDVLGKIYDVVFHCARHTRFFHFIIETNRIFRVHKSRTNSLWRHTNCSIEYVEAGYLFRIFIKIGCLKRWWRKKIAEKKLASSVGVQCWRPINQYYTWHGRKKQMAVKKMADFPNLAIILSNQH